MKPTYFKTPADFRAWLARNHATCEELLVGMVKKGTGKRSITWPEAVDQALCFGWIDGVRRNIDDERYSIRFTPRKPGSRWSAINIRRASQLEAEGLMKPAGRQAFSTRTEARSRTYSYEREKPAELDTSLAKVWKANRKAAAFFDTLAPSYRRKILHWVMAAKSADVRMGRLEKAIATFENGKKL